MQILFMYLSANLCLLFEAFNLFTCKVIIDTFILAIIFVCVVFFLPFSCSLSCDLDNYLVLCFKSFFFYCVYLLKTFGLWFPWGFFYNSMYIYKIALNCCFHSFQSTSSILHLYFPPLSWLLGLIYFCMDDFPSFIICFPLLVSFPIHDFLVSSCGSFLCA